MSYFSTCLPYLCRGGGRLILSCSEKMIIDDEMKEHNTAEKDRQRSIYRVTIAGSVINVALLAFKFIAGIVGGSAAMIADAVHSLSDFLTDVVVLVFVRMSNKPIDRDHDYGHGKYETLATALIGIALLAVGLMICYNGLTKTWAAINGTVLPQPGVIALMAALLSIGLKEWAYRFTAKVGQRVQSQAVVANAWHHRSDALSSVGTAVGIGGAILLGHRWTVLDPLAAIVVSVFILKAAYRLISQSTSELLETSLPDDIEDEMVQLALQDNLVSEVHNLRSRRIGNRIALEMHLRLPGSLSLYEAHEHATQIERRIKARFGDNTIVTLHVEPQKIGGVYRRPAD
jgi:cation diffusion facilitator family transporter